MKLSEWNEILSYAKDLCGKAAVFSKTIDLR